MLKIKQRGSILQIVLIIFLVLILNLNLVFTTIIENSRSVERIKSINENRLIELAIINYYKSTIANDLLFSDNIVVNEYEVNYTVDAMGDYYIITTTINKNDDSYSFILEILLDSLIITSFDYQ